MEASSGPAARASAPSERSVPSAAPRAAAGARAAASAVMHDTANAVAATVHHYILVRSEPAPLGNRSTISLQRCLLSGLMLGVLDGFQKARIQIPLHSNFCTCCQ